MFSKPNNEQNKFFVQFRRFTASEDFSERLQNADKNRQKPTFLQLQLRYCFPTTQFEMGEKNHDL